MRTEARHHSPGQARRHDAALRSVVRAMLLLSAGVACLFAISALGANRNILLVIADDLGFDSLSLYNTNSAASLPPTPNINALASRGVRFVNAYAYPTCSPS